MSSPIYDNKRNMYVCNVPKARKDNPVVKEGEPYIWIRRDKFSRKEYFKNYEEFNKEYPEPTFSEIHKGDLTMLKEYDRAKRKDSK